jgi:hypothetical protein
MPGTWVGRKTTQLRIAFIPMSFLLFRALDVVISRPAIPAVAEIFSDLSRRRRGRAVTAG